LTHEEVVEMEARRSETEFDAPGRAARGGDIEAARRDTTVGAATPTVDDGIGAKDLTFGAGILGAVALVAIALGIILSFT
jgi:hypothetical protein